MEEDKQFLIEFQHDSRFLGHNGFGMLLVTAPSFELACEKIHEYVVPMHNPHAYDGKGFSWDEKFIKARDFRNLTI